MAKCTQVQLGDRNDCVAKDFALGVVFLFAGMSLGFWLLWCAISMGYL